MRREQIQNQSLLLRVFPFSHADWADTIIVKWRFDAIKIIMSLRKDSFLCKFDISDEFKFIPTKPSQWSLYCMEWKSSYYFYVKLSFGCRSSPIIFDNLSRAVCYIAEYNYKYDIAHCALSIKSFILRSVSL
jgi:hypothetical protein